MIASATKDELIEAMRRFDDELRPSDEWRDWDANPAHRYAIEHQGRTYPVKKVISLATGTPVSDFSGGREANGFVEKRDLRVIQLRHGFEGFRSQLDAILREYNDPDRGDFGKANPLWKRFEEAASTLKSSPAVAPRESLRVRPSVGRGVWANVPWIALLDERETTSIQHGVYVVYLFREDMSGVYLTFIQGVNQLFNDHSAREARRELSARSAELREGAADLTKSGFWLDNDVDLRTKGQLGRRYELATIAHKLYPREALPDDQELLDDLERLLQVYDVYLEARPQKDVRAPSVASTPGFDRSAAADAVVDWIAGHGFHFEPWQVGTFLAAARTKPFVLLAGVSGTGKTKLPELVARGTGGSSEVIPVTPEWTDSAELLGYTDLRGTFRPGQLLEVVREATDNPEREFVAVVDEMNLARVEYYFAEVLSRMEDDPTISGGPRPLMPSAPEDWGGLHLPSNLLLVGTVNMDESTHGFSRKVLDRAFTLEFSRVELAEWRRPPVTLPDPAAWPSEAWQPRARTLGSLTDPTEDERRRVNSTITELEAANSILQRAQLQVGYRVRDELALFCLHAHDLQEVFVDGSEARVDPLDVGLTMKLLPRIAGGNDLIRDVLIRLLGWAARGETNLTESQATDVVETWREAGADDVVGDARLPRTTARLCLMWSRLEGEGFTSYWL